MNENNLIIHIGHPKTGSSALQSFFALNYERLISCNVNYPLPKNYKDAATGKISSGNRSLIRENFKNLNPNNNHTTLYSGEHLYAELLDEKFRHELCYLAKQQKLKIKFVLYTRDFFEFSFSGWNQYIKRAGGVLGYSDFMLSSLLMPHSLNGDNYRSLKKWIDISRNEDIDLEIYNYEKHKVNIAKHFTDNVFRLEYDAMGFESIKNITINRSLSLAECELQRQFNLHFYTSSSSFISDPLVENIPSIRSEVPYFSKDTYNSIVERYKPLIDEINQFLPKREIIQISAYETIQSRFANNNDLGFMFTAKQLECFAKSVSVNLIKNNSKSLKAEIIKKLSNVPKHLKDRLNSFFRN